MALAGWRGGGRGCEGARESEGGCRPVMGPRSGAVTLAAVCVSLSVCLGRCCRVAPMASERPMTTPRRSMVMVSGESRIVNVSVDANEKRDGSGSGTPGQWAWGNQGAALAGYVTGVWSLESRSCSCHPGSELSLPPATAVKDGRCQPGPLSRTEQARAAGEAATVTVTVTVTRRTRIGKPSPSALASSRKASGVGATSTGAPASRPHWEHHTSS
ncbi:hypothetical protein BDV95DRAFT_94395 [Massariosphaeria phaeospora]|uniref:Uncharacterized protein n=1 Tax=Massariosphaeria phaeospora TaxID=100035 RepID=A0A7C8I7D4_9PLEO|nr:hypothetical protein BDV95DRAFT_94395 [Massariosphaeria phaeospora]